MLVLDGQLLVSINGSHSRCRQRARREPRSSSRSTSFANPRKSADLNFTKSGHTLRTTHQLGIGVQRSDSPWLHGFFREGRAKSTRFRLWGAQNPSARPSSEPHTSSTGHRRTHLPTTDAHGVKSRVGEPMGRHRRHCGVEHAAKSANFGPKSVFFKDNMSWRLRHWF